MINDTLSTEACLSCLCNWNAEGSHPSRGRIGSIHPDTEIMARIFIGYHSELVGTRLSEMLTELDNVDLTGVVFESDKLEYSLDTLSPDIAILDIRLLIASHIGDVNMLNQRFPATKFILLYDFPYNQYSRECKRFGAEYCFDTLHEFTDIGQVIADYNRRDRRTCGTLPS